MPREIIIEAHEYIKRHYREPETDDPIARWLPHPEVARRICGVLIVKGMPYEEMDDAMQEVLLKSLAAFRAGKRVPPNLHEMRIYCTTITKRHVYGERRTAARRERLGHAGICERDPDSYTPLEYGAPERRHPVDAARLLEVAAQLFREGEMPARGVEILQGRARGWTYPRIARELEITLATAKDRMKKMRRLCRKRMAKLLREAA